jgi:long-chain acyl-CoA synthetase
MSGMPAEPGQPSDFADLPRLVAEHAAARPDHRALVCGDHAISYASLDALMNRVACGLQRDGVAARDVVAIAAPTSIEYFAVFMGALRAGVAVTPLATASSVEALRKMIDDCGARRLFVSREVADRIGGHTRVEVPQTFFDGGDEAASFSNWLPPAGVTPPAVEIQPEWAFNIIYSSGTTSAPKGIVQSHDMRWQHIKRGRAAGYSPDSVCLVSTPLYSNTTLVSAVAALGAGAELVLMEKFDARRFLDLSQRYRATHAMLVPVQYARLMQHPEFDRFDLSSYQMKFATSAPFSAALKAEVVRRWPGGLTEYYGMTEGGATVTLRAHEHPDKLHTVGRPAPDLDVRLIDAAGREVAANGVGEIVGHSATMMIGYHNQPDKTREAEWYDESGKRFIRTGDIGQFDEDGFLVLKDRRKDLIISGGFNIYPSDLETVLDSHEAVAAAAVIGVPSDRWGETPVAFVELKPGVTLDGEELLLWANSKLGGMQRISALRVLAQLPRGTIGKILKRELRESWRGA